MQTRSHWAPAVAAFTLAACASTPDAYHDLRADIDRLPGKRKGESVDLSADPFEGRDELTRPALVEAVLARNPSLETARQAWIRATEKVPRETSLEDPRLSYSVAPLSPLDDDVRFGQVITLSQRFPWPGKRRARGEVAAAEAEAARSEYRVVRLELALAAATLFDDYYRLARALEINERHIELLEDAQVSARSEFESGRATLQDPLQAEVEASHLRHRQLVLEGARDETIARLNGLLHRDYDRDLPPPPSERRIPDPIEASDDVLIAEAIRARTELDGAKATIRAGEAALEVAERDFYPDIGVSATYNSMWAQRSHQLMLGVSANLPIWRERRHAGVDRARAHIRGAEADREHVATEIATEVIATHRRVRERLHVVRHYENQILPATRDRVDAARAAFSAGNLSFFTFVDALKSLQDHELEYEEHIAELYKRRAALARAVGRVPALAELAFDAPEEEVPHDRD